MASLTRWTWLKVFSSNTSNLPSVIVTVLSSNRVSTIAIISMEYRSCGRVFLFANLIVDAASAVDVRRNIPIGSMPSIAAEIVITMLWN